MISNKRLLLLSAMEGWYHRQGHVVDVNYAAARMLPDIGYLKAGNIFEGFIVRLNDAVGQPNFDVGPYISLASKLILHSPEERTRTAAIRYLRSVQFITKEFAPEDSREKGKVDERLKRLHHTWRQRARKGGVEAECTESDLLSAIRRIAPQPPKRRNSRTLVHASRTPA